MRKLLPVLAAASFALSIFASGCAKEKSPPPPQPSKTDNSAQGKKTAKPRLKLFTGTIEALDETKGTLTLKGPKGTMGFRVHDKSKEHLEGLKIGDKVIVKHVDETALSIVKPRTGKSALAWKDNGAL